jgi:hypothetical protein
VALPAQSAAAVAGAGWRLDLFANTVAHERSRAAVGRFSEQVSGEAAPDEGLPLMRLLAGAVPPGGVVVSAWGPLRRCAAGRRRRLPAGPAALLRLHRRICPPPLPSIAPAAATSLAPASPEPPGRRRAAGLSLDKAASAPPSWLRGSEGQRQLARQKAAAAAAGAELNPSQRAAVSATLKRTLTLWQGPPGTGKTRTLLRFVQAALAGLPPQGQVLCTAASNVAVDNMVAGLLELGIRVGWEFGSCGGSGSSRGVISSWVLRLEGWARLRWPAAALCAAQLPPIPAPQGGGGGGGESSA